MAQKTKFVRIDLDTYERLERLKEQLRAPSFSAAISKLMDQEVISDAVYLSSDVLSHLHQIANENNTDLSGAVRVLIEHHGIANEKLTEIIDLVKKK